MWNNDDTRLVERLPIHDHFFHLTWTILEIEVTMPPASPILDWFSLGSPESTSTAPTTVEPPQAPDVSSKKHAACDECRMHVNYTSEMISKS